LFFEVVTMLTRKQHELLMFIHERIKESGVSPSFDEMKEALETAAAGHGRRAAKGACAIQTAAGGWFGSGPGRR
jgi:hypothetical protein